MARLNKNSNQNFQCESLNELFRFVAGITRLLRAAMRRWDNDPSFKKENYKHFKIMVYTQVEAQKEIKPFYQILILIINTTS